MTALINYFSAIPEITCFPILSVLAISSITRLIYIQSFFGGTKFPEQSTTWDKTIYSDKLEHVQDERTDQLPKYRIRVRVGGIEFSQI